MRRDQSQNHNRVGLKALLLNYVDFRVSQTFTSDYFCLTETHDTPSKNIWGLSICENCLFPQISGLIPDAALMKGIALYQLLCINMKPYSILVISRICKPEDRFLGAVPKYVVLGMLHHEDFMVRRHLSAIKYIHNDVIFDFSDRTAVRLLLRLSRLFNN